MSELETLHLSLFDLAMNQKELHCQMLLEGHAQAAENAWECYQELKLQTAMAAGLVAVKP